MSEDTLDGLPEPPTSRPWPVRFASEDQDVATSKSWPASDMLTRPVGVVGDEPVLNLTSNHDGDEDDATSKSWPRPSDMPSFGVVGDELVLDLVYSPQDTTTDTSSSPAAAFLSAFVSPPAPSSQPDANTIAGYDIGATIGHGGFSTIKLATSPSGGTVAVKIVRHSAFNSLSPREKARHRSRLSHEARVWVSLSHENILPLFDSHYTPEATYLITLYCPAGSLLDILKREGSPALEQTDVGCMFRQVVKALRYLHEIMGLVHGDIKLENVLVDESGVCRLTDFGLSRRIGGDSSQVSSDDDEEPFSTGHRDRIKRSGTSALPVHLSLMRHGPQRHRNSSPLPASVTPPTHPDHTFLPGSLPYAAPELLLPHARATEAANGHSRRPTAHPAQDMWALGVLLYTLLTGMLPFRDPFEPRLQMKILRGTSLFFFCVPRYILRPAYIGTYEPPAAIGPLAESVLKGCLERNVGERWTIAMVDNASWGIGYGNVDIDPIIREEQCSQSLSRVRALRPLGQLSPPGCDELSACMSSCSLTSSVGMHSPRQRGRGVRRGDVRSQSRSPSPSVAPRTPDDDDGEAATYFSTRRQRRVGRHRDSGGDDVQIVMEDEGGEEWDATRREGVYDGERVGVNVRESGLELDDAGLGLDEGSAKKERVDVGVTRGRQGVGSGGMLKEGRKESQSRTRSWSFDSLER